MSDKFNLVQYLSSNDAEFTKSHKITVSEDMYSEQKKYLLFLSKQNNSAREISNLILETLQRGGLSIDNSYAIKIPDTTTVQYKGKNWNLFLPKVYDEYTIPAQINIDDFYIVFLGKHFKNDEVQRLGKAYDNRGALLFLTEQLIEKEAQVKGIDVDNVRLERENRKLHKKYKIFGMFKQPNVYSDLEAELTKTYNQERRRTNLFIEQACNKN